MPVPSRRYGATADATTPGQTAPPPNRPLASDAAFLAELLERFRLDPDVRTRSYSKGNRQKVALIAAFMTRPDVLLLDEPTDGLDPLMEAEFQTVAREAAARGQTVFLSSHLLDEVEDLCHRVAILRAGRLVEVCALDDQRPLDASVVEVSRCSGGSASSRARPSSVYWGGCRRYM